jgi:hypothetical protein
MEFDKYQVRKAVLIAAGSIVLGSTVPLLQAGPALAPFLNASSSRSSRPVATPQVETDATADALVFSSPAANPAEAPAAGQPEIEQRRVEVESTSAASAPVPSAPTDGTSAASAPAPSVSASDPVPTTAQVIVQQLATAEQLLRTGHVTAVMDFGDQVQSSTDLVFELMDEQHASSVARMRALVTYLGSDGPRETEHVIIGDQSWRRQPEGGWTREADLETVMDQVQVYLTHASQAREPQVMGADSPPGQVRWFDPLRGGMVQVEVDARAGVPQRLRWATSDTGPILNVTYDGWNAAVSIPDPTADGMQ